ncbi:hypothetical protein HK104_008838 [Borealophlyctis nickersoniae]|nr:hypothetical protein HK104_008838 [Borealophlyctis nickersoniae]
MSSYTDWSEAAPEPREVEGLPQMAAFANGNELLVSMLVETSTLSAVPPKHPLLQKSSEVDVGGRTAEGKPEPPRRTSGYGGDTARRISTNPNAPPLSRKPSSLSPITTDRRFSTVSAASPTTPLPASSPVSLETFSDPEYAAYLTRLTSLSLDALRREPLLLAEESRHANTQLSALAFSEYRSFLSANAATHEIGKTLSTLEDRIDTLDSALPELEASCVSFGDASTDVLKRRKRIGTVLEQHQRLLEILEIPQLVDTFIRTGCYAEAMDLQSYVARLADRHPDLTLIKSVADEVSASASVMLTQLVALLRGPVKLPLCLSVIGYLKKMGSFQEADLRILFLQQRDAFLRGLLDDIHETDPVEYLKQYVGTSRTHFMDILVQYRNIFSDLHHHYPLPSTSSSADLSANADAPFDVPTPYATQSILSSYVTHTMDRFLTTLDNHFPSISTVSSLSSILTDTMYYGMSLGRVGTDFRGLLTSRFESAVERIVKSKMEDGVEDFIEWAADCGSEMKGAVVGGSGGSRYIGSASIPKPSSSSSLSTNVVSPPDILLTYPPLARLTNAFFSSYNELRILPFISLLPPLAQFVTEALTGCAGVLAEFGEGNWDLWGDESRRLFVEVCRVFMSGVVGCVAAGLGKVYGSVKDRNEVDVKRVGEALERWVVEETAVREEEAEAYRVPRDVGTVVEEAVEEAEGAGTTVDGGVAVGDAAGDVDTGSSLGNAHAVSEGNVAAEVVESQSQLNTT